jgi:hypothetical protein
LWSGGEPGGVRTDQIGSLMVGVRSRRFHSQVSVGRIYQADADNADGAPRAAAGYLTVGATIP